MLLSLPLEEARYASSHILCRHFNDVLIRPLHGGTHGFIKSYQSVKDKFIEHPQCFTFQFVGFMLFFMFLSYISIMVVVFQTKSPGHLMDAMARYWGQY